MNFRNLNQLLIALATSCYFLYYLHTASDWHFLDNINLIIHEGGHSLFGVLGHFLGILGGSLMQVLIPGIFAYYFFDQGQYFSSSLLLFWLGQNFVNVSIYARDAVAMNLPLLGGDGVLHDWNTILGETGLLPYTALIANSIYGIGLTIIFLAIALSIVTSQSKKERVYL